MAGHQRKSAKRRKLMLKSAKNSTSEEKGLPKKKGRKKGDVTEKKLKGVALFF